MRYIKLLRLLPLKWRAACWKRIRARIQREAYHKFLREQKAGAEAPSRESNLL